MGTLYATFCLEDLVCCCLICDIMLVVWLMNVNMCVLMYEHSYEC